MLSASLLLATALAQAVAAPAAGAAAPPGAFWKSPADHPPDALRHKRHYYVSNEFHQDKFKPVIEGLGGGYVGVGSDQQFLFLTWQKADWAWVLDYDDEVVRINRMHVAFIKQAASPDEFLALWDPEQAGRAWPLVKALGTDDHDGKMLKKDFDFAGVHVWKRLKGVKAAGEKRGVKNFLDDAEQYAFLRQRVIDGRVRVMNGNLFGSDAITGLGKAAAEMGVAVRVFYLSNAEEYLTYDDAFRKNLRALPYDDKSLILRTLPIPPMKSNRYVYNVQSAKNFLGWLERPWVKDVKNISPWRTPKPKPHELQEELTRVEVGPEAVLAARRAEKERKAAVGAGGGAGKRDKPEAAE